MTGSVLTRWTALRACVHQCTVVNYASTVSIQGGNSVAVVVTVGVAVVVVVVIVVVKHA